jgi:hypothetical protein
MVESVYEILDVLQQFIKHNVLAMDSSSGPLHGRFPLCTVVCVVYTHPVRLVVSAS